MSYAYNYIGQELTTKTGRTYRFTRGLGHGGMGEVYLAINVNDPTERTAIKIIKPDLIADRTEKSLEDTIRRFHKEARMGESLHRQNPERFTEIISIGTSGKMPYFQMEFFDGLQLDQLLNRETRAEEPETEELKAASTIAAKSTISSLFRRAISQIGDTFHNSLIKMKLLQERHPDVEITLENMKDYTTPDIEQQTIQMTRPLEITQSMIINTNQTQQEKTRTHRPKKWITLEDSIEIHYQVTESLDSLQNTKHESRTGRQGKAIAHRDIKPSNVLVSVKGGPTSKDRIKVKLIDNGLIYVEGEKEDKPKTQTDTLDPSTFQGEILGTPQYMPPECAQSEQITTSTDTYSIGVMLYEHLTGKYPRGQGKEKPLAIIMDAVNNTPVTWITKERSDISQQLAFTVHKMLIADKTKRPDINTVKNELDYFRNNPGKIRAHVTPQEDIDNLADHIINLEEQLGITEDNLQDKVLEIYSDEEEEKRKVLTELIESYKKLALMSYDNSTKGASNLGYWTTLKTYVEARTLLENPDLKELSEIEAIIELEKHRLKELGITEDKTYFTQRKQQRKSKEVDPRYKSLLESPEYVSVDILCGNADSLQTGDQEDSITDQEGLDEYKRTLKQLQTAIQGIQLPTEEKLRIHYVTLTRAKSQFGQQLGEYGSADPVLADTLKQTRRTLDAAIKKTQQALGM